MEENTYKYILDELGKQSKINETFGQSINSITNAYDTLADYTCKINKGLLNTFKIRNRLHSCIFIGLVVVSVSQARKIKSLELKVDALDMKLSHAKLDYGTFYNRDENEVEE